MCTLIFHCPYTTAAVCLIIIIAIAASSSLHGNRVRPKNIKHKREHETTDTKKVIIQAYCSANKIYNKQHFDLLGVMPMLKFALACPTDRNNYHFFATSSKPCESCQGNEAFMSTWTMWERIIKEVIQNQD